MENRVIWTGEAEVDGRLTGVRAVRDADSVWVEVQEYVENRAQWLASFDDGLDADVFELALLGLTENSGQSR